MKKKWAEVLLRFCQKFETTKVLIAVAAFYGTMILLARADMAYELGMQVYIKSAQLACLVLTFAGFTVTSLHKVWSARTRSVRGCTNETSIAGDS